MYKRAYIIILLLPLVVFASIITGLMGATDLNLENLKVRNVDGTTEIEFMVSGKASYTDFRLDNKIVVDLLEVGTALDGMSWDVNRGGIENISVSRIPSAGLARVIIQCGEKYDYSIEAGDGGTIYLEMQSNAESFSTWSAAQTAGEEMVEQEGTEEVKTVPRQGLISIRLEKADLVTVLRSIARYSGMNMIISDEVTGAISLELRDVHWEKALELILATKGYTYIIDEGIIRVGTAKAFAEEREKSEMAKPMIRKVFTLEFTTPTELEKTIESMLSSRGALETDTRTNSLIVTDIPSKVESIQQLVKVLDKETPQVAIASRVVDMDRSAARELGISWSVKNLRRSDWNIEGDASHVTPPEPASGVFLNIGTIKNYANIAAKLAAMERNQRLKTIATPRVTTVNNKEATVFGGKRFAVTTTDINGQPITRWFKAGIELTVTPHINSLEDITMDIAVELSDVVPGAENPTITQTQAETQSLVKNGETLVIGGFIQKSTSKTKSGVPILKDIPLLGNLFSKTTTEERNREVLIFITPHIVKEEMKESSKI